MKRRARSIQPRFCSSLERSAFIGWMFVEDGAFSKLRGKHQQPTEGEQERPHAERQGGAANPRLFKLRGSPSAEQRAGQQHGDEDVAPASASGFAGLLSQALALGFGLA